MTDHLDDNKENPFSAPETMLNNGPLIDEDLIEYASRGSRFVAIILDNIVNFAAFCLVWFLVYQVYSAISGQNFDDIFVPKQEPSPLFFTVMFIFMFLVVLSFPVIYVALNGWLMAKHGQTLGKKALGIRMVKTDCTQASFSRLFFLRYLVGMQVLSQVPAYSLIDALFIFREDRRCLHDMMSGTIVIRA